MADLPPIEQRIAAVKARVGIAGVVERHVKLSGSGGSRNRRGLCPFHSGSSASFSVQGDKQFAHCFGCAWHGDAIRFVQDFFGIPFIAALEQLEAEAGIGTGGSPSLDTSGRGPVQRERQPTARRERPMVEPLEMGRALWRMGHREDHATRRYFRGRGVPEHVLGAERLSSFRFLGLAPVMQWGEGARPGDVPQAPALVALVRKPVMLSNELAPADPPRLELVACGVHVTYLNPDGTDTMLRRKPWAKPGDPDPFLPKRRMLGPVGGGCVVLGEYAPDVHLYVGEGNETVLSGMALADADSGAVGVATLSLDNLQGGPKLWSNRTWPLHAIEPDPERRSFIIAGHQGPVTGLIDSDMAPLRGKRDRRSGEPLGEAVVERKGGPVVRRAITGAERARICGELFVKGWRAAGVAQVEALRAPIGMDFNDVAQAAEAMGAA